MQQKCSFLFIFRNTLCHQIQIKQAFPQLPVSCKGVQIFLWIEGGKAGHIKKRNKRRSWQSLWTWSCTQTGSTVHHLSDKMLGLSTQMTSKNIHYLKTNWILVANVTMSPRWPYNKPELTIERKYTLFGCHDTWKAWPTQLSMILCTFSMSENFG